MRDELTDVDVPRRSGLGVLFRWTPFTLLLRGCSVADVAAATTSATLPRSYRLRITDDGLLLRYYGGGSPMDPAWSVRAGMEQTTEGVLLTGEQRYLLDRIYFCFFTTMTVAVLAIVGFLAGRAVWDGVVACLVVSLIPGGLAALVYALAPTTVARQDRRAKQLLQEAVGGS